MKGYRHLAIILYSFCYCFLLHIQNRIYNEILLTISLLFINSIHVVKSYKALNQFIYQIKEEVINQDQYQDQLGMGQYQDQLGMGQYQDQLGMGQY